MKKNRSSAGTYALRSLRNGHFRRNTLFVKKFQFFEGEYKEQKDEALVFNYQAKRVNKQTGDNLFKYQKIGNKISRISKFHNFNENKLDLEYIFTYDAHGNIIKQSFKNTYGNMEYYEIQYEQKEGNEEIFLGTKDWVINALFHQITFNNFFEVSY